MARIVFKNLISGPATRRYPSVVRPAFESSRGRIAIDYPECIHCGGKTSNFENCANKSCNKLVLICEACKQEDALLFHTKACRTAVTA